MREPQGVVIGARRFVQMQPRHVAHHRIAQHAVLAHGKPMARWERQDEMVGVEGKHAKSVGVAIAAGVRRMASASA